MILLDITHILGCYVRYVLLYCQLNKLVGGSDVRAYSDILRSAVNYSAGSYA
ncbi:hypothetical protein ACFLWO_04650 [Chloroflexota bacterium]